jgi:hypothetical protein
MGEYGLSVTFPCITIQTPYGPVQIGGQCTPNLQNVTTNVTPVKSSLTSFMPYLLFIGMAAAIALVVIKPKTKKEIIK